MKTYHILLTAALFSALAMNTEARPRSQAEMAQAAAQAINSQRSAVRKAPRKGVPVVLEAHRQLSIMGFHDSDGYAIVTADDLLPAVVGYSDKSFAADKVCDGFQWWLQAMTEAADYYVSQGRPARVVRPDADKHQPFVRPLLSTEWGQEEPFNNACPMLPDAELYPRHCVVGCVATAISQILNYYKWPSTGHGTTTLQVPYGDPTGTVYNYDFSQCHFDWDHMRNTYTPGNYTEAEAEAVANLSHAMGMMAIMQYGLDFSGAISDDAEAGLHDYFGVSTAKLYERNDLFGFGENYNEADWSYMAFNELSNERPVYYAGADADNQGGHAFVLDGYDADGLVHVNWGWHGRFDGYYDISILNPRIYHFSKQQEMILGICPPEKANGMRQVVTVDEAGTLATEIEAVKSVLGDAVSFSAIQVQGPLNATDLKALAAMHELTTIDLSEASFEAGLLPPMAFYGCANLRTLLLPRSMHDYGDGALAGCSNLNVLSIPEGDGSGYVVKGGVVYSPDMAEVIAVLPTAPDTVNVSEGVTRLHPHAFEGCKYVRIVTLPGSLDVIGSRALADVLIMRELHVLGQLPAEADADCFDGVDPGFLKFFIPAGSRQAYEHAKGWRQLFRSDNVYEEGTMVRARDLTRRYGEDVEEYYYEIIGERVKGLPRLSCDARKDSPAGKYPIVVSRGTIEADGVTYVNGTLTVEGGPAGLNESAQTTGASLTLGYCNGQTSTSTQWGGQGNDYTSAAIYVPQSMLSTMLGADIKSVRVGLATRLNIDELTVWVRTSLDGANLAEGVLNRRQTRVQQGWNEVSLVSAYTIPAETEGLYIGYTYHHTSLSNAVSIVGTTPAHTAFFKRSESDEWQDVSEQGAISLEAIVSGSSLAQWDLALQQATLTPSLSDGAHAYKLSAEVANMGTSDVEGFWLTLTSEGISPVTTHVDVNVPSGRQVPVKLIVTTDAAITAEATASISQIDGGADTNPANNTATTLVSFERNVLLEEFTTESCPNCPGGAETMQTAIASRPMFEGRINVVCHHSAFNTDWLTQPCDLDYVWMFNEDGQTYAPAWMINRMPEFESNIASGHRQAIYWTNDAAAFARTLEAAMGMEAHLALGAKATLTDDGKLSVSVSGLRDASLEADDLRLTVYVTEDHIAAREQLSHDGTLSGYEHQHVVRAYNSSWGDLITWNGTQFSTALTFDADPTWKSADLKVVAVVGHYDAQSNLNCTIENSVSVPVATTSADAIRPLDSLSDADDIVYNLKGMRLGQRQRQRGLIIVRRADGTVVKQFQQ